MRPIKFRAWHSVANKMFSADQMTTDQLTLLPTGQFINVSSVTTQMSIIIPVDVMIPLQFTGLRDKNGQEVYEGDIIRSVFESIPGEIKQVFICNEIAFHNGAFCYMSELDRKRSCPIDEIDWKRTEVAGNVYENPQLLNVELGDEEVWDESRYNHIDDVKPVIKKNLTNWVDYQKAFMQMQVADNFLAESIKATDWEEVRCSFFNQDLSAKEAFRGMFYEE